MLDFADVVAINKFERRGSEDARRDVARQLVRNREAFGVVVGGHAGLRHAAPPASTTTASPRCTSTCAIELGRARACRSSRACCAPVDDQGVDRRCGPRFPLARVALPVRDRRRGARLSRADRAQSRAGPAAAAAAAGRGRSGRSRVDLPARDGVARRLTRCGTLGRGGRAGDGPDQPDGAATRGRRSSSPTPATSRSSSSATRNCARRCARTTLSGNSVSRVALPRYTDDGELLQLPAPREPARLLPLHRRGFPVQARRRGPGPHVRRRGRRVPHQPPLPPAVRRASRPPGCRPRSTR